VDSLETTSATLSRLRILACVADLETGQVVRELSEGWGWQNPVIVDGGIAEARAALEQSAAPNLLIVDIDGSNDPVGDLYALSAVCQPDMNVIAVGKRSDLALYRNLIELGLTEYLNKPLTVAMFERALRRGQRTPANASERRQTQLVTLIGARGGIGTTTIATSLAWCIAQHHQKTVSAVDLDLHFGNLGLSLDLAPSAGLREVLEYPTRIDSRLLGSAMMDAGTRLRVLAAEEPLIDQLRAAPAAADAIVSVLRADCDFIIVDLPRHLDDMVRRIITLASTSIVVTDLSLAAARDALRLVEFCKLLAPAAHHLVVANQVGAAHRGETGRAEFEQATRLTLDHVIPFDAGTALATASSGKPLPAALRNSKAAEAMRGVAVQLCGAETEAQTTKRSILPNWLRRSA
jgi:pilus assembly protein CpaE